MAFEGERADGHGPVLLPRPAQGGDQARRDGSLASVRRHIRLAEEARDFHARNKSGGFLGKGKRSAIWTRSSLPVPQLVPRLRRRAAKDVLAGPSISQRLSAGTGRKNQSFGAPVRRLPLGRVAAATAPVRVASKTRVPAKTAAPGRVAQSSSKKIKRCFFKTKAPIAVGRSSCLPPPLLAASRGGEIFRPEVSNQSVDPRPGIVDARNFQADERRHHPCASAHSGVTSAGPAFFKDCPRLAFTATAIPPPPSASYRIARLDDR